MVLNEHGCIVRDLWLEVSLHLVHAVTDAWLVMPNHVHAIVRLLVGDRLQRRLLRWRYGTTVEGDVHVTMQLDRDALEVEDTVVRR